MDDFFNTFECTLEIYQGDDVQTRPVNEPVYAIQQEFLQLIQQAGQIGTPVKIKLFRDDPIWDPFEGRMRDVENSISFMNNAWRDVHREDEAVA